MPKPLRNISIPNPCHESWEGMTPHAQGKFCNSCQKCVVDFQAMTDGEVIDYLNGQKGKSICGKMNNRQLTRLNQALIPKRSSRKWMFAAVIGGLLTAVTLPTAQAQGNVPQQTRSDLSTKKGEHIEFSEKLPFAASGTIEGHIFIEGGTESVEGAIIRTSSQKHVGTISNEDGKFSLKIQDTQEKEMVLEVLFIGMKTVKYPITITEKEFYISIPDIVLKNEELENLDIIMIGAISYRFPRNLWHKVKWLFRKKH